MKLYSTLADWWPLLSPPAEYAEEAEEYWRILSQAARRPIQTMLELGCGGGNNASYLKQRCRMALSDMSLEMLEVSKRLNPECEHVVGDMRTLRLGREFDAVFVQDAVMYLTSGEDLRRAMATAFVHCRPGGVALFAPDGLRESFQSQTEHGAGDTNGRSLRWMSWTYDPDPADETYDALHVYVMREDGKPARVEHEVHHWGLFARADWLKWLGEAGFEPRVVRDHWGTEIFTAVRPETD